MATKIVSTIQPAWPPTPLAKPSPPPLLPDICYDHKSYLSRDARGTSYIRVDRRSITDHLIQFGFSDELEKGKEYSPIDALLVRIQREQHVVWTGALAGYPAGAVTMNGQPILVTSSPEFLTPQTGDWTQLQQVLENLLGPEQLIYFYGWLKVSLRMFRLRLFQPGQALALFGPPGAGKNLLRQWITAMLGGRVAFPIDYMMGRTNFNSELFGAETLAIEDQQEGVDYRARRHFGARIKDLTVNSERRCEAKHCAAVTLSPLTRLIISANDEAERVLILPQLDSDVADKLMIFKVNKQPFPVATSGPEGFASFYAKIVAQLPAFAAFLEGWEIPEELASERYGITHFHHPDIVEHLRRLAPERQLLELIDATILAGKDSWSGTATELEGELQDDESWTKHSARKLLGSAQSIGTYLSRLESTDPERVSREKVEGKSEWTIRVSKETMQAREKRRRRTEEQNTKILGAKKAVSDQRYGAMKRNLGLQGPDGC